jgi:hypothetical protein
MVATFISFLPALALYALVDNGTALFGADYVSAGLAGVVNPYPAIFI